MEISVFYAWQSDRPVKGNRYLIRDAAQDACKRISEDASNPYQITLDSDTQGEAGMCDIPNTILKKIVECDIFLADLTLIASSESQPSKFIPNPNVVFELGWAARSKKFGSLIGIVNEAYGEIDSQIFDIKRRASITYDLNSEDTENSTKRKSAKNSLSKSLEKAIRLAIERVVKPRREKRQNSERQSLQDAQVEFTERVAKRAFHRFNQFPAVLTTITFEPIPEERFDEIYEVLNLKGAGPQADDNAIYWANHAAMTEMSFDGRLYHAYGGDYISVQNQARINNRNAPGAQPPPFLTARGVQRNIIRHVLGSSKLLRELNLPLPWQIMISLYGVEGFTLYDDEVYEESRRKFEDKTVYLPLVKIHDYTQVENVMVTGKALYPAMKRLCRTVGMTVNPGYTSDGLWNERF